MGRHYILDESNTPVAVDLMAWVSFIDRDRNRVALDERGDVTVSTVFLGLDHSFTPGDGPPVLWETMIFGGEHAGYQERYTSHVGAVEGHARAVAMAFGGAEDR
jgi:hypothetical protein